jgi:peptidoglycan/LPS O-acetylase OafA/YrhL
MRTLTWMGTISCSLYLVHTIIGGKIVNVGGRLPQSPWNATLIIATACGASILLAWIFYLLIEGLTPSPKIGPDEVRESYSGGKPGKDFFRWLRNGIQ